MQNEIDDSRIDTIRELDAPAAIIESFPVGARAHQTVQQGRKAVQDILHERDDRLLVIVGPCSIHDTDAAIEYADRLATLRDRLGDSLELVMRVYFEKPRTTVGWKGLINDPGLDGSFDIARGLRLARELLLAINNMGLPAGAEFLDMIVPQYIADLTTWAAIGARTTESQIHRQLASGLSCPVGFKNGTNGNVKIAADAVKAASESHHFLAVTKAGQAAIATTSGNQDCHVILRGGIEPNYDMKNVIEAAKVAEQSAIAPRLMIDASHANSNKDPERQSIVIDNVADQVIAGENRIFGLMIESHLVAGRQELIPGQPLTYGQSTTDGCIDWSTSVRCLDRLADAVSQRRCLRKTA